MANELSPTTPVLDMKIAANHIREGRFQRSLALLTAATSVISGLRSPTSTTGEVTAAA